MQQCSFFTQGYTKYRLLLLLLVLPSVLVGVTQEVKFYILLYFFKIACLTLNTFAQYYQLVVANSFYAEVMKQGIHSIITMMFKKRQELSQREDNKKEPSTLLNDGVTYQLLVLLISNDIIILPASKKSNNHNLVYKIMIIRSIMILAVASQPVSPQWSKAISSSLTRIHPRYYTSSQQQQFIVFVLY